MEDDEHEQKTGKVIDIIEYLERRMNRSSDEQKDLVKNLVNFLEHLTPEDIASQKRYDEFNEEHEKPMYHEPMYFLFEIRRAKKDLDRETYIKTEPSVQCESLFARVLEVFRKCCEHQKKSYDYETLKSSKRMVYNALLKYDATALAIGVILETDKFDLKYSRKTSLRWLEETRSDISSEEKALTLLNKINVNTTELNMKLWDRLKEIANHSAATPKLYYILEYDIERIYDMAQYKQTCEARMLKVLPWAYSSLFV